MPTHELPAFLPTAKAGGFLRSIGEVADELRLSSASVRRISREELPRGSGRGPRARYLASDVAAYISAWVKKS